MAVGFEREPASSMLHRQGRVDHREGDALAFEPLVAVGRGRCRASWRRRRVEALVQTVASVVDVVGLGAERGHRVARADDVAAAELEQVHLGSGPARPW